MKPRTKAIFLMMVLPPLMMELLTANLPGFVFFHPVFLITVILGYSVPILAIRELAVRLRFSLAGIFIMGLAYGIFNEGIGAKTLLLMEKVPVSTFDNYGYFFGINFPWVAYIITVHAIVSVLIPILIVHYLYPEVKTQPWFSKKTGFALLFLATAVGTAIFLSPQPFPSNPIYLFYWSSPPV